MPDSKAIRGLSKFQRHWLRGASRTLIVGSKVHEGTDKPDRRALYADAIGIDLFDGEGVDLVHDLEQPLDIGLFDHVDCVSVLEHVRRPWRMAANIEALMEPQATILVSVPFVWRIHGYPSDLWRMTAEALEVLFPSIHWMHSTYLVEGRQYPKPLTHDIGEIRWLARSELLAVGFKCR